MANSYGLNSDELLSDLHRRLGLPDPNQRDAYQHAAHPDVVARMRANAEAVRQAAERANTNAAQSRPAPKLTGSVPKLTHSHRLPIR